MEILQETSRWCDRSIQGARQSVSGNGRLEAAFLLGTRAAETILATIRSNYLLQPSCKREPSTYAISLSHCDDNSIC